MKKSEFDVNLNKWPALLVVGDKVTDEQAIEINFRTTSAWWSTNDHEFLDFIAKTIGTTTRNFMGIDFNQSIRDAWGHIELEYLANSNIVSAYIGGPHGWCSWDGDVFANSYNIGKWPTVEEVFNEWKAIAEAFPFLNLRCQLLDGEQCEVDDRPVSAIVEFIVKDGTVEVIIPDRVPMTTVDSDGNVKKFTRMYNSLYREHGTEADFIERFETFKRIRGI